MYQYQNQRAKGMTKTQAKFIVDEDGGCEKLADPPLTAGFDAHAFWDPSQATSWYQEFDENSQYSGALRRLLPVGDFALVDWEVDSDHDREKARVNQLNLDIIRKRQHGEYLFNLKFLNESIGLQKRCKEVGWEANVERLQGQFDALLESEDAMRHANAVTDLNVARAALLVNPGDLEIQQAVTLAEHYVHWYDPNSGFLVQGDLEPPDRGTEFGRKMHDVHRDYPPVFERTAVSASELSEYTRQQFKFLDKKVDEETEKLVLHFKPMKDVVRWTNLLGLQLEQGWRLVNPKNWFQCRTEAWLDPVVSAHIEERRRCQENDDPVGVRLAKLMNNALYGRLQLKVRRFTDDELVDLADTEESHKLQVKKTSDPRHVGFKVLNPNLAIFSSRKKKAHLNQPVFVASQCLDYAKESMFKFNLLYKETMKSAGAEARAIRTDTDCVGYYVTSNDPFFDPYDELLKMQRQHPIFDCSGPPKDHPLFDTTYCKSTDRFGDEVDGQIILQVNVIKSKCYSFLKLSLGAKKMGKGTPKKTVERMCSHWEYTACIRGTSMHTQFQKKDYTKLCKSKQQVYTMRMNRVVLSNVYTTRYCLDSVNLLPFGFKTAWLPPVPQDAAALDDFYGPEEVHHAHGGGGTSRKRSHSPEPEDTHAGKRAHLD